LIWDIDKRSVILDLNYEYRLEENSVTIVKYIGNATELVIPDKIEGKCVTSIGNYAFVNQRKIRRIEFPHGLQRIGSHAFYDCRGLESVIFSDSLTDIFDGAFKNCDAIHRVELHMYEGILTSVKSLLEEFGQEITLWLNYHLEEQNQKACLIFPRYLHNYVEFTQARIINQETHGFGVHYREHLLDSRIDYKGYDELFLLVSKVEEVELNCKIALARVIYPYQVSAHILPVYVQYLRDYVGTWLVKVLQEEQMEALRQLEAQEFYTQEVLAEALNLAHQLGKIEFVTYFMTLKQRMFPGKQRKFEL
jgi:hypothetical protein